MIQPEEFDAFYKDARTRLLLQTYALTGDLPAARAAVRDSFVVTWHHWRKVSRLPDPEAWIRPHAWSHAQRRHTARLWHRDRSLEPDTKATFAALGKLSLTQRRALLLRHLTELPGSERARELGVPRAEAERQLQQATERFLAAREVPAEAIPGLLESLHRRVVDNPWPRPSIIRRAGAARRRTHTLVGAAVAVAALVVSGSVVNGAPPSGGSAGRGAESAAGLAEPDDGITPFDADRLLSADALSVLLDGRGWQEARTTDNRRGKALTTPCQPRRYADPDGISALARSFTTAPVKGEPQVSAVQNTELSASVQAARATWRRVVTWYGGCPAPRVQLLGTHTVSGVGDDALLFHLRSWRSPVSTYVAGVARTGQVVTTTFLRTTAAEVDLDEAGRLLGRAVDRLCSTSVGARCAPSPRLRAAPPVKVGEAPGLLVEADLPPVTGVSRPWVGTQPRQARQNTAATRCDLTDFSRAPVDHAITRTFLIPDAGLPAAFGLTETVGTLPEEKARAFVQTIRQRMASCSDRDLGSDVEQLASSSSGSRDLSVWRVTSELDDDRTVTYLMGIARVGTAVGQVGFVPGRDATLGVEPFEAVMWRAAARLQYLPRPKR